MTKRIAIALLVAASLAGGVQAEKRWYAGVLVGQADLEGHGFDAVTQAGALFGWHLYQGPGGNLAVEGEFTTTISQGDLNIDIDLGSPRPEWELDTLGVYAAYRSGGLFYVKARAGYVDGSAEVRSSGALIQLADPSDHAASAGLGFGWRFMKLFAVEAQWTRSFFDRELDVYSVGVNF